MSKGVSTNNLRFQFVEKTESEVGDGTKFPIKVTPDQLSAIMYRVKDAWFTSGDVFWDYGGSTGNLSVLGSLTQGDPFVMDLGGNYLERSYALQRDSTWDYERHYFQEGYSNPYYVKAAFYDTAFDIGDKEYAMFYPDNESITDHPYNGINTPCPLVLGQLNASDFVLGNSLYEAYTFRCGFSHLYLNDSFNAPLSYGIAYYPDGDPSATSLVFLSLVFSGEVAWVDVNESGNPLDPLNELYLGMVFNMDTDGGTNFSTIQLGFDSLGCNLVLELAEGDSVSCPMYFGGVSGSPTTASDFVITAKEWWPYAKGSPATPVWDSVTGAKL